MTEYNIKRPISRSPVHPGELLKEDILPVLGLAVSDVAEILNISRQHLHRILTGSQPINVGIALKISRLTGASAKLLMSMQQNFDLWHAQKELKHDLDQIEPALAKEPTIKYQSKVSKRQIGGSKARKKTRRTGE